jgi:hypothetical protein
MGCGLVVATSCVDVRPVCIKLEGTRHIHLDFWTRPTRLETYTFGLNPKTLNPNPGHLDVRPVGRGAAGHLVLQLPVGLLQLDLHARAHRLLSTGRG